MEFTVRKLWKIEKLWEDLDSSHNKKKPEDCRQLPLSTEASSSHTGQQQGTFPNKTQNDHGQFSFVHVLHVVWPSFDFTICCHSVQEL